jgi:hypothetical protein
MDVLRKGLPKTCRGTQLFSHQPCLYRGLTRSPGKKGLYTKALFLRAKALKQHNYQANYYKQKTYWHSAHQQPQVSTTA